MKELFADYLDVPIINIKYFDVEMSEDQNNFVYSVTYRDEEYNYKKEEIGLLNLLRFLHGKFYNERRL